MDDWKQNLGSFFEKEVSKSKEELPEFDQFILDVVIPAMQEIAAELKLHGRDVTVRNSQSSAAVIVCKDGDEEMTYRIQGRTFPNAVLPFAEVRFRQRKGRKLVTVESMFRSGAPGYKLSDITKEEVIQHFVENYTTRVQRD
ncbi:hypothetical protein BVX97_02975 [bacterium E08(2017)]|nr:hypothetical protein BVX97_02975 [bacterium E08(2017)]